jgi:hypothetical protein
VCVEGPAASKKLCTPPNSKLLFIYPGFLKHPKEVFCTSCSSSGLTIVSSFLHHYHALCELWDNTKHCCDLGA